jgi:hypothetical protein
MGTDHSGSVMPQSTPLFATVGESAFQVVGWRQCGDTLQPLMISIDDGVDVAGGIAEARGRRVRYWTDRMQALWDRHQDMAKIKFEPIKSGAFPLLERGPGVGGQLRCPECGETNIDRKDYSDSGAVTVFPDRDDFDSPIGTRGGYVQIELFCINGHRFALVIANHKGEEMIGLARPVEPDAADAGR